MNRLETLLQRMPSQFTREPDSNNFKLLSLIAEGSNENRVVYDTILKFWDVDQAEGVGLDRLGKDEGISRGGMDDEEYRKMIKIQCIVNMSDGDIPTMNTILDAYMGDWFIGLQDGTHEFEPASLLLHVTDKAKYVPDHLVKRIKPAGVRVYVLLSQLVDKLRLYVGTYGWVFNGRICGRFKTASRPGNAERLPQYAMGAYTFPFDAPITGRFKTDTVPAAKANSRVNVVAETYTFGKNRRRCGKFRAGGALS